MQLMEYSNIDKVRYSHRRTGQEILGGRTLVCPTSCIAASVVGRSGGMLPRENFEM